MAREGIQTVVREVLRLRKGGATPDDEVRAVEALGWKPEEVKAEIDKAPPGFLSSIAQGITFGFGDELRGAVRGGARALMGEEFGPAYAEERDRTRAAQDLFAAGNPLLDAGLQIGGSVATGALLPGAAALRGAQTMMGAGIRGGISGAGAGAVYGLGTGEGMADRTARAAVGGLAGGVIGGFMAPVTEAIGRGVAMQSGRGARGIARAQLAEAVGDEGMTLAQAADEIAAANQAGKTGVTPMDVMQGGRIGGLARDVAQSPNPAQAALRSQISNRQIQQFDRVISDLGEFTGVGAKRSLETGRRLMQQREAQAAPAFARAWQFDAASSPAIRDAFAQLMRTDAGPRAYKRAVAVAKNEAPSFKPPSLDELIDEAGNLRAMPDMRFLHFMKIGLDDLYGSVVKGSEEGLGPVLANSIKGVRNAFRDTLKAENPLYGRALDQFAGSKALEDAIELGREMIVKSPDEFADALRGLPASEAEMFRIGAVSKLAEIVGQSARGPTADFTRRLSSINMEEKLPILIGDPAKADQFLKRFGTEQAFSRTANRVAGNSVTSEGRELAELAGGDVAAGQVMAEAYRAGTPSGFLMSLFNATLGRIGKQLSAAFKQTYRGEMGGMLTRQDSEAEALLRALAARPPAPSYRSPAVVPPLSIGAGQVLLPEQRRDLIAR